MASSLRGDFHLDLSGLVEVMSEVPNLFLLWQYLYGIPVHTNVYRSASYGAAVCLVSFN